MRYQLFIKHFLNKETANERQILTSWRFENPDNNKIYVKLLKHWKEGRFLESYNLYNKVSIMNQIAKKANES